VTGPSGLFNNAYWSLPVEFQYYIIFPILVVSLKAKGIIGPIVISLALYLPPKLGIFEFHKFAVFYLAFSFCGGIIVGWFYKTSRVKISAYLCFPILMIILIIVSSITNDIVVFPDIMLISNKWNW
jgi:peptidoglycan/LPS O-acetylase OafA/YrhL